MHKKISSDHVIFGKFLKHVIKFIAISNSYDSKQNTLKSIDLFTHNVAMTEIKILNINYSLKKEINFNLSKNLQVKMVCSL